MRLRRQLILASLLTLCLPWAGCQYIKEMETAMRHGQEIALSASAQAVADRLRSEPHFIDALQSTSHSTNPNVQVYAHPLHYAIILDGYDDEWRFQHFQPRPLRYSDQTAEGTEKLPTYIAGRYQNTLSLFIDVDDNNLRYHNPAKRQLLNGDYIQLQMGNPSQTYIVRSGAPGNVLALRQRPGNGNGNSHNTLQSEPAIKGYWQERSGGYQVELQIPQHLAQSHLSITVVDADSNDPTDSNWYSTAPKGEAAPPIAQVASDIQQAITIFAHDDLRLRVVSKNHWLIAEAGTLEQDGNPQNSNAFALPEAPKQHGLLTWIYRLALGSEPMPTLDTPEANGYVKANEVTNALLGKPASQWYQWKNQRVGRTAVPVVYENEEGTQVMGAVLAEQSSDSLLAITNSAFTRLLFYSVIASLIAGVGLLAYASWLSWRIRRLKRAVDTAIDDNGALIQTFPVSRAKDEVGDLSRSYYQLLTRLKEYTDYLRTLSSKLSHELRTPLAVVRSSIDNLHQQPLDNDAKVYVTRALEGSERLSRILNAMSAASNVEQSIQHAEFNEIALDTLLYELANAYQDIYPEVIITAEVALPEKANKNLTASTELIVQMLDKLVDNAADFCPANGRITLRLTQTLQQRKAALQLQVENDGPLLPETMATQLFDSLVSIRTQSQQKPTDNTHLGLGLHIAKLIAEAHHATITAKNRGDNRGVIFTITFSTP